MARVSEANRGHRSPSDYSTYLASDTNFLKAAEIMTTYAYGECSNNNDREIQILQCDLLTEDGGHEIDPTRLDYKWENPQSFLYDEFLEPLLKSFHKRLKKLVDRQMDHRLTIVFRDRIRWHLKEFCYKTSSHGIPMLGQAPNMIYRIVWIILLSGCAFTFVYEAIAVVDKYYRMDKITDIQLKFDTAPFPSITLCNLNPYRDSKIRDDETVNKILNIFKAVMRVAATAGDLERLKEAGVMKRAIRKRSDGTSGIFEPVNSVCICEEDEECEADPGKVPTESDTMCICAFDRVSHDAWPCHPNVLWFEI
uniref:Amiloride-sensitive sodium channel n=1 Tax=Angiostrongylus cantonensis TaxID=6313 RepID=A0A0K0D0N4_ANGCA